MEIILEIPDDIAASFIRNGESIERFILECVARDGFRSGKLTQEHVRSILNFSDDTQTVAFLSLHGLS